MSKRFHAQLALRNMHYLRLWPCDPYEGTITVVLQWGGKWSDPVWSVEYEFRGWAARPFIRWAHWRWDRDVRKQNARKKP